MRIAIVGSRTFEPLDWVRLKVRDLDWMHYKGLTIVSGGAKGVDTQAIVAAAHIGIPYKVWPADWNQFGNAAGFMRNQQIIEDSDKIIAFWDGESKGTKYTIDLALAAKKNLEVIFPPSDGSGIGALP